MSQMSRRFDMASKKNKSLRRISESLESKIKNIALYEKWKSYGTQMTWLLGFCLRRPHFLL